MKKWLLIVLIILLIIAVVAVVAVNRLTGNVTISDSVELIINEGSTTTTIADQLKDSGIVKSALGFRLFARNKGVDSDFKAGTYTFVAGNWSLDDVCEQLIAGGKSDGKAVWMTIVEGLTAEQTFVALSEAGFGLVENYLTYANNGDFSRYPYIPAKEDVIKPGNRLDGFLFPDTYQLDPEWSESQIIDLLLEQFHKVWTNNGFDKVAAESDYSVFEIVTMASLVEKEAQVAEDRPIIAGVFYKRLEIGMKLETCASIQFLLGEPKVDLTYSDLAIDNPYNCYMYAGLPPGPIASPGLASLQAALYPTESDYLYFRARNDGSHRFSNTLEEHTTYHDGDQ